MRAHQVFAAMSPERASAVLRRIAEKSPAMFAQSVHAASLAMRARPVYLKRQPFEKRAQAIRRTVARVSANALAEELLAVYFLECRKALLLEWLDRVGLEHEDGALVEQAPGPPEPGKLHAAVDAFRREDEDAEDRELLLRAFAAQTAIEWPDLDALLARDAT